MRRSSSNRSRTAVRRALASVSPLLLLPQIAVASPFSPAQVDSAIADCASQIDPDSLITYIQTLQGFFTRHTASDTVSATVGIGAARRVTLAQVDARSLPIKLRDGVARLFAPFL